MSYRTRTRLFCEIPSRMHPPINLMIFRWPVELICFKTSNSLNSSFQSCWPRFAIMKKNRTVYFPHPNSEKSTWLQYKTRLDYSFTFVQCNRSITPILLKSFSLLFCITRRFYSSKYTQRSTVAMFSKIAGLVRAWPW
jgi:hypothetical protein